MTDATANALPTDGLLSLLDRAVHPDIDASAAPYRDLLGWGDHPRRTGPAADHRGASLRPAHWPSSLLLTRRPGTLAEGELGRRRPQLQPQALR